MLELCDLLKNMGNSNNTRLADLSTIDPEIYCGSGEDSIDLIRSPQQGGFDLTQYAAVCEPGAIKEPYINTPSHTVSHNDLSQMINALNISQPGGLNFPITQQLLVNLLALLELSQTWLCAESMEEEDSGDSTNQLSYDYNCKLDKTSCPNNSSWFKATRVWRGILPPRFLSDNATFSCKVFLGGVPWDLTEDLLVEAFSRFGKARVQWPCKEPKGYVYVILESDKRVKALLNNCTCTVSSGNGKSWFYRIQSKKMKFKEVQLIPWSLEDTNFSHSPSAKITPHCTVFVGALHGMINAEGLFTIMNDLFGGVVYAGIDTDKFKYPIGSARVTFNNRRSYMEAVTAAFVEVKTPKFTKKLQVDPYMNDSVCSSCMVRSGNYFCRDLTCFRYFCHTCWGVQHQSDFHRPLMRKAKANIVHSENIL